MHRHFQEFDEQGYTIIERVLSLGQVDEEVKILKESYEENHASANEPGSSRTHNLTARGKIFQEIIQLAEIVACMEYLLGEDYILSDMDARSPMPGMLDQGLHWEGSSFLPNSPYNVHTLLPAEAQSIMALTEFTAEKGATRLLPRSHLRDIDPASVPAAQARFNYNQGIE